MSTLKPACATVVGLGLLLLAYGVGSPAVAKRSERCARKGSVTLTATKLVRIYRDKRSDFDAVVYACHRPSGRATPLGAVSAGGSYQYGGLRATAIHGSVVAFGVISDPDGDEGGPGYTIAVAKLPRSTPAYEDSRQIRAVQMTPFDPQADDTLGVERLLLAPNGTLAFASCQAFDGNHPDSCRRPLVSARVVVVPFDAQSRTYKPSVTLAEGPGLDPRSLRFSPSKTRIAWTRDDQTQAAPIP